MFNVEKAQEKLRDLLGKTGEPSVCMSIYDKGDIHYISVGYRDIENKLPANENTIYAIGSCTKAFISTALAILVDEGKISFDDKIKKHIPTFEMYDKYVEQDITIRDILCHRSGLPRHDLAWYLYADTITSPELVKKIKYLKPNEPFRYKMQYNNIMYELAGYLIEIVSGQTWQEFITNRIAKPIGMKNILFSDANELQSFSNIAKGYQCDTNTKNLVQMSYFYFKNIGASGSIYTSASDLIKWVAAYINKGKIENEQLVSAHSITECITPQSIIQSQLPDSENPFDKYRLFSTYGFGWFVECHRGHTLVRHGGNINGFSSSVGFLPNEQFGFSILSNSEMSLLPDALTYYLVDLYYNKDDVDWYEVNKKYRINMFKNMSNDEEGSSANNRKHEPFRFAIDKAIGKYYFEGYGEIVITQSEATLNYEFGNDYGYLEHLTNNYFIMKSKSNGDDYLIEFRLDFNGNVISIESNLEPSIGENICFRKM